MIISVAGASMVSGLFSISGAAAPIVLPIAATMVFAKWVYDVYQQTYAITLQ